MDLFAYLNEALAIGSAGMATYLVWARQRDKMRRERLAQKRRDEKVEAERLERLEKKRLEREREKVAALEQRAKDIELRQEAERTRMEKKIDEQVAKLEAQADELTALQMNFARALGALESYQSCSEGNCPFRNGRGRELLEEFRPR